MLFHMLRRFISITMLPLSLSRYAAFYADFHAFADFLIRHMLRYFRHYFDFRCRICHAATLRHFRHAFRFFERRLAAALFAYYYAIAIDFLRYHAHCRFRCLRY